MAKRPLIFDKTTKKIVEHNWKLCLLCQEDKKNEKLSYSYDYASSAEMLIDVNEIGTMPFNFDFDQLNDGSGVQQTLAKKHARYHRPCKLKLYTHLDREKKHTETKTDNDNCLSPVKR